MSLNTKQAFLFTLVIIAGLALVPAAAAHGSDSGGGTEDANTTTACTFPHDEWRKEMTIAGVKIQEDQHCEPDNPYIVASTVKGTNNVPKMVRMKSGLDKSAVVKKNDRDNDGDPDVIHITLNVIEYNGYQASGAIQKIAPGVAPTMWGFAPPTNGMVNNKSKARQALEMPSPPIRVEEGDTVRVTLRNTHYFPHTIHFHGVDHNFAVNGSGNDGVPVVSEGPIQAGESRTYEFTPNQTGTMFYHCHVVPNVHVQMGLNGMFIIEENRTNNNVQTLNIGGGKVRHPSKAVKENYTSQYDLQFQALDKQLASIPDTDAAPATIAKKMNRMWDATDAKPDYFLLNGKSFPYTIHDSMIIVEPNERYKLHVSNAGPGQISLHTHGHKFNITAYDGVPVAEENQVKRDVVAVSSAQRVTLALNTTIDGLNSYGKGVWFTHDHREKAVTTNGISPGGSITMITYESYLTDHGMPKTAASLDRFFNTSYYNGEVAYWNMSQTQNLTPDALETGPHYKHAHGDYRVKMEMQMKMGKGMVTNGQTEPPEGCDTIRDTKTITIRGGTESAGHGEAYGFSKEELTFKPCTKVTVKFVNTDEVRHQFMIHGLPKSDYSGGMFMIAADPGKNVTGTFVTPKEEGRYMFHCGVPQHEQKGMHGGITVSDGEEEYEPVPMKELGFGVLAGLAALGVVVARREYFR